MPSRFTYKVPFISSRYLSHTVYLDELDGLTDKDLELLATEVHALHAECSESLDRTGSVLTGPGVVVKLLRTASTFAYAIEQEQTKRQRKISVLELLNQLNAVTAERDALKIQLQEAVA